MRRTHMSETTFLQELHKMYTACAKAAQNSVWLTTKQVGHKTFKKSGKPYPIPSGCLVRATNGKKTISVIIEAKRAKAFQVGLQHVLATNVKSPVVATTPAVVKA
eukprot:PhF_6_TR9456/c0_g1_i2/m.14774/K03104/SRP14; signal recognition particle subunit SRP14